jgi:general secretion pathway protein G
LTHGVKLEIFKSMPKTHHSSFTCLPAGKVIHNSKKGFTLIELMVVIAIIGMLFAIIITSAAVIKRNSRDAQRQSDLRSIQSALEQYNADQTYYPSSWNLATPIPTSLTSNTGNPNQSPSPNPTPRVYLNRVPADPNSGVGNNYLYSPLPSTNPACDNATNGNCTSYCLYAKLENLTSFAASCPSLAPYTFSLSQP